MIIAIIAIIITETRLAKNFQKQEGVDSILLPNMTEFPSNGGLMFGQRSSMQTVSGEFVWVIVTKSLVGFEQAAAGERQRFYL